MNALIEKGIVNEMSCGSNLAYVLSNNAFFLSTEYKVLQSQKNNCFVRCMKMLYNGKIQLYYHVGPYKPFSSLLSTLDADRFITIISNILSDIIEVKNNGFLSCRNIDISFEHIFVDPTTYKVSLVYLPLNHQMFDDDSIFESAFRTCLIKLIAGFRNLSSPKTMQLSSDLSNGSFTLEDLYNRLKGNESAAPRDNHSSVKNHPVQYVRIVSLNAPARVEINITKDEFVLGKKADRVDGTLSFNDKISRVHCKINRNGEEFTITDLHSANGTYVNRIRLLPDQPSPIKNGDVVRLANSDFQIVIRQEG